MNKSIKQGIQMGMCALISTCMACSQHDAEAPTDKTAVSAEPPQQIQESDMNNSSISGILTQQVSGAVADLSARTGIAADAIAVSEARVVQWGSGAIGCPKEGMNYTQAIVPGVLVILEAGGVLYRYHGRSEAELVYCPDERAEEPAYGPGQEFI
jgi:hypothetical protein